MISWSEVIVLACIISILIVCAIYIGRLPHPTTYREKQAKDLMEKAESDMDDKEFYLYVKESNRDKDLEISRE